MGDVYGSNNMVNLTTIRYLRISANFFLPSPENNGVLSESGVLNADLHIFNYQRYMYQFKETHFWCKKAVGTGYIDPEYVDT